MDRENLNVYLLTFAVRGTELKMVLNRFLFRVLMVLMAVTIYVSWPPPPLHSDSRIP